VLVEVLIFEGCPNAEGTEQMVRDAVKALNTAADIEVVKVVDNEDAVAKRFLGSPSIRINGRDIEVDEDDTTKYSMRCRVYRSGEQSSGVPPKELLLSALAKAAGHGNGCDV
jgi:hypothetical protein